EMWGGTSRDFSDASLGELAPGQTLQWKEWMYAFQGIRGLTYADRTAAVNFTYDSAAQKLELFFFATAPIQAELAIQVGDEHLWSQRLNVSPLKTYHKVVSLRGRHIAGPMLPRLFVTRNGQPLFITR